MKAFPFSFIAILLSFQLNHCIAATIKCNCPDDAASSSSSSSSSIQSQQTTNEKSSLSSSAVLNENAANSDAEAASLLTTEIPTHVVSNATEASDVKKFIQRVQNTLEKAKPWVDEIEKEAKRLEETAKRFGEGVIHRLGDLMDRIIGSDSTAANTGGGSFLSSIIGGAGGGGAEAAAAAAEAVDDEGAAAVVVENGAASITIHANTATHNHVAGHNKNENVVTTNLNAAANAAHAAANAAQAAAAIIDETIENEIINDDEGNVQQKLQMCPDGFVADVNDICQRVDY